MKRLFLALAILAAGMSLFCVFRTSAIRLGNESSMTSQAWLTQSQALAQARARQIELTARIRELKEVVLAHPHDSGESALANSIITNGTSRLAPEVRERLLAELRFDWNSSGDYVVVSKD